MRKILLQFFVFFTITSYSQTISGTIFDENKVPLDGVTVYFDGTTISSITTNDGKYSFDFSKKINVTLVIRALGYETVFVANPFETNDQKIYLSVKKEALREIVITKKQFSRAQLLNVFREQFLGKSKAGKTCKILNEDKINLEYDYDAFYLYADAYEPIQIENSFLGYKVQYELLNFNVRFNQKSIDYDAVMSSLVMGNTLFTEIENNSKLKKVRDDAYFGSSVHFFKNLSENNWGKSKFLLFFGKFQDDPKYYFRVTNEGDLKKVEVLYNNVKNVFIPKPVPEFYSDFNLLFKNRKQSKVIFTTTLFYVDRYGNFTENDKIFFGGDIGAKRVGDMLPTNYEP